MEKSEIISFMQKAKNCSIATISREGEPRVRIINPAIISEKEFLFHTGTFKELYSELEQCGSIELCFLDEESYMQIRLRGTLVPDDSPETTKEILSLPSRQFLKGWCEKVGKDSFYSMFKVYRIKKADAIVWRLEDNNKPNVLIPLYS